MQGSQIMVFGGITGNMYIVSRDRDIAYTVLDGINKSRNSLKLHCEYPYFVARVKAKKTKGILLRYTGIHGIKYQRDMS